MMKDFLNKKFLFSFFVTITILLSIFPISTKAIAPEIFDDPDPCADITGLVVGAVIDKGKSVVSGIVSSVPFIGGVTEQPVSDSEARDLLKENKALLCKIKKNTQAVKDKTVGKTIFGIPTEVVGLPSSWDGIAKIAMKVIMKKLTDSTVNWINGGFNGSPAFVTNPGRYFTEIADGLAGEFIGGENSPLNFLCTPFANNIKLSLRNNYATSQGYNPQCTFSDIKGFLDEGFNRGGWDAWFELTQNPNNNPYDSYLNAQVELNSRIANKLSIAQEELRWGSGFLSFKGDDGEIRTPGKVIEGQLELVLGQGVTDLGLARSFDDVVSALIGAMTKKVFSSTGLRSGGSYSGSESGIETGSEFTPEKQNFGPGTNAAQAVTCSPDKDFALVGEPVTWKAIGVQADDITYSYEWLGEGAGTQGDTLVQSYITAGSKKVSVKVTSIRIGTGTTIPYIQSSTIACNTAVMISKYSPLSASCTVLPAGGSRTRITGTCGSGDLCGTEKPYWDNLFLHTPLNITRWKDGTLDSVLNELFQKHFILWTVKITGGSGELKFFSVSNASSDKRGLRIGGLEGEMGSASITATGSKKNNLLLVGTPKEFVLEIPAYYHRDGANSGTGAIKIEVIDNDDTVTNIINMTCPSVRIL